MADRLAQVSGHITNTYGRGLLAGEVAIITGELCVHNIYLPVQHDTLYIAARSLAFQVNNTSQTSAD